MSPSKCDGHNIYMKTKSAHQSIAYHTRTRHELSCIKLDSIPILFYSILFFFFWFTPLLFFCLIRFSRVWEIGDGDCLVYVT